MRSRALLLLWAGGCAASSTLDRESLPSIETYSDEAGVFLEEHELIDLYPGKDGPEARSTYRRRVMITSPKGREWGDFGTSYDLDFGRIESAKATVHWPDGKTESHPMGDWKDRPSWETYSVYENDRTLYLDLPDLPAGTVVDFEIVRVQLKADLFAQRFAFGGRSPHLNISFEVRAPESWELDHRAMKTGRIIDLPPDFDGVEDGRRVVRWTRRDLDPVPWEPYGPSVSDLIPHVAVRLSRWVHAGEVHEGMASMGEYARYLSSLQAGTAEPDPEIEAIVREVLADAPDDPYQKAARLYGWVQENIRYVSIQVGMGGWRPYPATEVMRNRFGDCKDKATLLKSMLAVAGIESRLASLYAHDGIPRDFVLPGLGFTNHAILAIELPDRRVIVDPTTRTVPFGHLPISDQEAPLLLVGEEEQPIVRAPGSDAEMNRRFTHLAVRSSEPGVWDARLALEAHGGIAADLHQRLIRQADDPDDAITAYANVSSSTAKNPEWSVAPDGSGSVQAEVEVTFRQVGSKVADRWLLRPSDFFWTRWSDLQPGERETPVLIQMRRKLVDRVDIDLEGGRVHRLPEPVTIRSPYGEFELAWSSTDDGVRFERTLVLKASRVEPEAYSELMTFFQQMRTAESQPAQIVLGGTSS